MFGFSVLGFCPLLSTEIFHRKLRTARHSQTFEDEKEDSQDEDDRKVSFTCCACCVVSFVLLLATRHRHVALILWALSQAVPAPCPLPSYLFKMLCCCFTASLSSSTLSAACLTRFCHTFSCISCSVSADFARRPNGNVFYQSGLAQNRRHPKVKVYMHLILVSVITFSVTNLSKPYLCLAGHVSALSESGYRLCGFLMIYLHKICGMLKMELSTLLYGTSVHVRKWKYFQKW